MLMLILMIELDSLLYPCSLSHHQEVEVGSLYSVSNLINAIPYRIMLTLTGVAFKKFQLELKQR